MSTRPPKDHNSKVKAGPVDSGRLKAFADHLKTLRDAFKEDCDTLLEDAEKAGIEKAALRRLVAWQGQDHVARAEREAIDDQYRFLAGERATPGVLPTEGMLAQAVDLFRVKATVRTVAEALRVSTGKAHKLKSQASAFLVHVHADMNADAERPHGPSSEVFTPAHDPETGECLTTTPDGPVTSTVAQHDPSVPSTFSGECLSGRDAPSDEHSESSHDARVVDRSVAGDMGAPTPAFDDGQREPGAVGGDADSRGPDRAAEEPDGAEAAPRAVAPVREGEASKSLYQRITGAFADIPREPPKATEAKANHPPQGAASVAAGDDWPVMPAALRRVQA